MEDSNKNGRVKNCPVAWNPGQDELCQCFKDTWNAKIPLLSGSSHPVLPSTAETRNQVGLMIVQVS